MSGAVAVAPRDAGDVPLLVARPHGHAAPLPLVLWFHGFRADAAANAAELRRLAAASFLVVGVDAVGHGRRRPADVEARLEAAGGRALPVMLPQVAATARELPAVVRWLAAHEGADAARVGVVGVSMGGYLAYRAVVEEPAIRAAVVLLGSPEWPHPDSPHDALDAFRRTALLSITAERDESVPPAAARRLHERLADGHPAPERARYVELAGAPHLMSAEQWETAMRETEGWLARWLK